MTSYIIWNISPDLFTIPEIAGYGPFPVRWYGLLFAAGFLIGQQIMIHIFKKENKPLQDIDTLTLVMVISTVIGARFGHFLFYEPEFLLKRPLDVILPPYSGLASHGAAIGIFTGLWIYSRKRAASGQTVWWVLDRMAIVAALGGAFIRFGNLMNSEIVGTPTTMPWGFVFVKNIEYQQIPRHPAQLYESISCFILFFLLIGVWNKYKSTTPKGLLTGIFLIWIFTLRFLYEFIKENQESFENTMALNMGQILSIPAILTGIYFVWNALNEQKTIAVKK